MPFRGHDGEDPEYLRDPIARFLALDAAFESGRPIFIQRTPQRLAAITLVLVPDSPEQIAEQVRALEQHLRGRLTWLSGVAPELVLVAAATLLRHGHDPEALLEELERVRRSMRALNMRRVAALEFISVVALHILAGGAPITDAQVERLRDIYKAMKTHHWWLTGPDDYPACALLTARPGAPAELALRAYNIYEALRAVGCSRGDPLQTASNMLAMAELPPSVVGERYQALFQGFKQAGIRIWSDAYDKLAVLCFLARPVPAIIETVVAYTQQLRDHSKWYEESHAFVFATNLAFVRLVGDDPELGPLADVKALLDMYAIVQQQQQAG